MIEQEAININNFAANQNELERIYLSAFTQGEHAQFISKKEVSDTLIKLFETGFGFIAKSENQIAGMLFAYPLEKNPEFPSEECIGFDWKKSLYIAEVLVDKPFRGRGIAKKLLEKIEETAVKKSYNTLTLRVWDENISAISLYKKFGFEETGITIYQTKYKNEQTSFEMKKLYLYKKLDCHERIYC